MDSKYDMHDIHEMVFLVKRKEELFSMEEHIVIEFLYHNRLLKLTPEERVKVLQLRENLTRLLIEWDNT